MVSINMVLFDGCVDGSHGRFALNNLLALMPHTPGQGSLHRLLTQAFVRSHSEFCTHSGRQPVYGSPKYSGRQRHEPTPLRSLQTALAPHGDGEHGFISSLIGGTRSMNIIRFFNFDSTTQESVREREESKSVRRERE